MELDKQGKENRALTNAYKAELQARGIIDYIALMTDVELPTQDTGMEESEVQ